MLLKLPSWTFIRTERRLAVDCRGMDSISRQKRQWQWRPRLVGWCRILLGGGGKEQRVFRNRNTTGSAVRSYDIYVWHGCRRATYSEVAIWYVQWYQEMDLNSDERKYLVNGQHWNRQSKTTTYFCSKLDSRCSSCLEIPILWEEVVQDLIDSDELQQLHHQVWGSMLDQGKTIKAVTRVGTTRNMPLYGKWQRRTVTMSSLVGARYNADNFFISHFCT